MGHHRANCHPPAVPATSRFIPLQIRISTNALEFRTQIPRAFLRTITFFGEIRMKRCAFVFLAFVSAIPVVAQSGAQPSAPEFKKMQALAGDWEGKDANGMPAK